MSSIAQKPWYDTILISLCISPISHCAYLAACGQACLFQRMKALIADRVLQSGSICMRLLRGNADGNQLFLEEAVPLKHLFGLRSAALRKLDDPVPILCNVALRLQLLHRRADTGF